MAVNENSPTGIFEIFPAAEINKFETIHQIQDMGRRHFDTDGAQHAPKEDNIPQQMAVDVIRIR
jgi:hypothetical protein